MHSVGTPGAPAIWTAVASDARGPACAGVRSDQLPADRSREPVSDGRDPALALHLLESADRTRPQTQGGSDVSCTFLTIS